VNATVTVAEAAKIKREEVEGAALLAEISSITIGDSTSGIGESALVLSGYESFAEATR
jgi:hypothetical protein